MTTSLSERLYIKDGVEANLRADGRGRLDYRFFSLDTGVIPHANGSARFKLDATDVMVAANLEIGEPDAETPNRGRIVCSVDCSASASSDYEGRGAENANIVLTSELERFLSDSKSIDLEGLCIVPGKHCWVLYIDAVVLDSAGNVLDAISIATKAALRSATLPALKVQKGESADQVSVEVVDDPSSFKRFPADSVPICVSLTKIGSHFIVDATLEEEACTSARVTVGVNAKGQVCGMHKSGAGGIAPSAVIQMTKDACKIGTHLLSKLDQELGKKLKDKAFDPSAALETLTEDDDL